MKYKKTENNAWASLVRTYEDENIQLADIIIHIKYPIDSDRLFGYSLIQPQFNVNCGLILHDYECFDITFNEIVLPYLPRKSGSISFHRWNPIGCWVCH